MLELKAQNLAGIKTDKLFFGDLGTNFKKVVLSTIEKSNEKDLVKIDLLNIKSIDPSFCREAFVKLIGELSLENIRPQLLFTNVNESARQNLEVSFSYHGKYCLAQLTDGRLEIIGKSSESFVETIKAMIKLREAKARDVGKELEIEEMNTVNNRLKILYDMCIITRKEITQESGGKEFVYFLKY